MTVIAGISGTLGAGQSNVARMSDGSYLAVWWDSGAQLSSYSWSATGASWSTPHVFAGSTFGYGITVAQNGDTVYAYVNSRFDQDLAIDTLSYNATAQTITVTTHSNFDSGNSLFGNSYGAEERLVYDSDHALVHAWANGQQIYALDPTNLGTYKYRQGANPTLGDPGLAYGNNTLWLARNGVVYAASVSGTSYGTFASTTVKSGASDNGTVAGGYDTANSQPFFVSHDATTSTLDLYTYNGTSWSHSTLLGSGTTGVSVADLMVGTVGNDLYVVYCSTVNYANGEIWLLRRHSGTWQTPTLIAGGANTGFVTPSLPQVMTSTGSASVPILYVTGTSSRQLNVQVYQSAVDLSGALSGTSAVSMSFGLVAPSASSVGPTDTGTSFFTPYSAKPPLFAIGIPLPAGGVDSIYGPFNFFLPGGTQHPLAGTYGGPYTLTFFDDIPPPNSVTHTTGQPLGASLRGAPLVRSYDQMVWHYLRLKGQVWYYLYALNRYVRRSAGAQAGHVAIRWPDPETGLVQTATCRWETIARLERSVAAVENVDLTFSYLGIDDAAPVPGIYIPDLTN